MIQIHLSYNYIYNYRPLIRRLGFRELWKQYGTDENRCMLPLYPSRSQLARMVNKAHVLTGNEQGWHQIMQLFPVNQQYI